MLSKREEPSTRNIPARHIRNRTQPPQPIPPATHQQRIRISNSNLPTQSERIRKRIHKPPFNNLSTLASTRKLSPATPSHRHHRRLEDSIQQLRKRTRIHPPSAPSRLDRNNLPLELRRSSDLDTKVVNSKVRLPPSHRLATTIPTRIRTDHRIEGEVDTVEIGEAIEAVIGGEVLDRVTATAIVLRIISRTTIMAKADLIGITIRGILRLVHRVVDIEVRGGMDTIGKEEEVRAHRS